MSRGDQLHLVVNMQSSGSHPAAWRAPGADPRAFVDIGYYRSLAATAERGLFDAVFLADHYSVPRHLGSRPGWTFDPFVTLTALAVDTSRIGVVGTISTTFTQPYSVARSVLSLQHLSRGRAGWNAVTTWDDTAARNYNLDRLPRKADRYRRADEFVDIVTRLWQSWGPAAFVLDKESGRFVDVDSLTRIDHRGEHFRVEGPLQVPSAPEGSPVVFQAGGSEAGRDLAAKYADGVFAAQTRLDDAREYYADVKRRVVRAGRPEQAVRILPGVVVVTAPTRQEAREKRRALDRLVGDETERFEKFKAAYGLSDVPIELDAPFPLDLVERVREHIPQRGFQDAAGALLADRTSTVRDIISEGGVGHRSLIGSPEDVADSLEEWFEAGAADGFTLMLDRSPDGLVDFVDLVVPVLQARGVYRRDYPAATLRENLAA